MRVSIPVLLALTVGCATGALMRDVIAPARAQGQAGPSYEYDMVAIENMVDNDKAAALKGLDEACPLFDKVAAARPNDGEAKLGRWDCDLARGNVLSDDVRYPELAAQSEQGQDLAVGGGCADRRGGVAGVAEPAGGQGARQPRQRADPVEQPRGPQAADVGAVAPA